MYTKESAAYEGFDRRALSPMLASTAIAAVVYASMSGFGALDA